jgi:hypothetical protein
MFVDRHRVLADAAGPRRLHPAERIGDRRCVAASAMPTPCRPTLRRALFIIVNIARMPAMLRPDQPADRPPLSPYAMVQVGEA